MTRLHWHAFSALALSTFALSACHKADQDTQAVTTLDSADASSVTPAGGMPTMAASSANSATSDAASVTDAATYLTKAGAGDLFEIESTDDLTVEAKTNLLKEHLRTRRRNSNFERT